MEGLPANALGDCEACAAIALPSTLGKYPVEGLLGRGGMGEVYLARHPELGTRVAIKILSPLGDETGLRARFLREARSMARIEHPGVVRVHDFVATEQGRLLLVMDYVEGETLRSRLDRGPLPLRESLDLGIGIADVLDAAHRAGVLHRDVKPSNILLPRSGGVRVLDFGISRTLADGESVTRTGELIGTPEYMAPEQILEAPEDVDERADVYALGVVLYEMVTGVCPFRAATVLAVLRRVESFEPPAPSSVVPGVAGELDALILATLDKVRERRPRSSSALAARLRDLRDALDPVAATSSPPSSRSSRSSRALGLVATLTLVCAIAAIWGWQIWDRREGPAVLPEIPAVQRLEEALRPSASQSLDRSMLLDLMARIPASADVSARVMRARGALALGWYRAACDDLEFAASAGSKSALEERVLAWHARTTVPLAIADLLDLRSLPGTEVDRLFPPDANSEIVALGRALALGQDGAVISRLEARGADEIAPRTRVLLTVLAALGRKQPTVAREALTSLSDPELSDSLVALLAAVVEGDGDLVRGEIERWDRRQPERYVLGLAWACAHRDRATRRAWLELAVASGAGDEPLIWYATSLLRDQARDPNLFDTNSADRVRGEVMRVPSTCVGSVLVQSLFTELIVGTFPAESLASLLGTGIFMRLPDARQSWNHEQRISVETRR